MRTIRIELAGLVHLWPDDGRTLILRVLPCAGPLWARPLDWVTL